MSTSQDLINRPYATGRLEDSGRSIEAFCLRMLSSGSFNLKNRWYAPAPRVRRDRNETMAIFARNPLRITVVFLLFALYDLGESVEKSKFGCLLCKRKSR